MEVVGCFPSNVFGVEYNLLSTIESTFLVYR